MTTDFVKNLFFKLLYSLLHIRWLAIFVVSRRILLVKCLAGVVWYFKLSHKVSLNKFLGPLIYITKQVIAKLHLTISCIFKHQTLQSLTITFILNSFHFIISLLSAAMVEKGVDCLVIGWSCKLLDFFSGSWWLKLKLFVVDCSGERTCFTQNKVLENLVLCFLLIDDYSFLFII